MTAIDTIRAYSANELATRAGCASPDSPASEGAQFLTTLRTTFLEALDYREITPGGDNVDAILERAEGAADTYTHTRWQEFVDLAAYTEDYDEYNFAGEPTTDLFELAGYGLTAIARRLLEALTAELTAGDNGTSPA
ncbi:MAG: hypothetical protein ABWZ30_00960 [Jiangellaceae bacterium]